MKEEQVIKYYVLCNRLKNVIRTGWLDWHVSRNRVESIAEHIYGVQQLAISMKYTYNYDVDLYKVIMMLAIHESEEIFIGDLTEFQISKEEKNKIGHEAIKKLFNNILDANELESLILEFDERKTKEAFFAYQCDKLECDIQAKLYDEENCVRLDNQKDNASFHNPNVKELLDKNMSWGEMWLEFGRERYPYDENFRNVSKYVEKNKIMERGNYDNN